MPKHLLGISEQDDILAIESGVNSLIVYRQLK